MDEGSVDAAKEDSEQCRRRMVMIAGGFLELCLLCLFCWRLDLELTPGYNQELSDTPKNYHGNIRHHFLVGVRCLISVYCLSKKEEGRGMVLPRTFLRSLRPRSHSTSSQSFKSYLAVSYLWCDESGDGVLLLLL